MSGKHNRYVRCDLCGEKKKVIAAVDLIIFTTISFHSKYWSFLHFLFGRCFGQVFCASLLVTRFSEAVCVIFEFGFVFPSVKCCDKHFYSH